MSVDLEELAAIIEQLDRTEFTDFLYEKGDLRIRVSRGGHFAESTSDASRSPAQPTPQSRPAPTAAPATAEAPASPAAAQGATTTSGLDPHHLPEGYHLVTAPMLGTFYASPKPGEPAFVERGSTVTADATVCIIEVMKLMNSVTAGAEGTIVEVFAADGTLVEHGEPLFAIEVAA